MCTCTILYVQFTPWKINGWNLKITCLKREIIFQTSIFGFDVNFQGCIRLAVSSNSDPENVPVKQSIARMIILLPRYFRNVGIWAAVGFFCGIGVCASSWQSGELVWAHGLIFWQLCFTESGDFRSQLIIIRKEIE